MGLQEPGSIQEGGKQAFTEGLLGTLVAQMVKNLACNAGDLGLIPGSGKIPWRREWLPTPIFLSGEFHGQRRLAGYSPWSNKELDATE